MQSVKEWAEDFAKYTWGRLNFVYHHKQARLYETTITDDLIFQINQRFVDKGAVLLLEHADNEKRNGNDIEFVVEYQNQFIIFPIQAKRIYAKQRYPRFSHENQLKHLMMYAKKVGGVPLYLLYNYNPRNFTHPAILCGKNLTTEHYGCTLVRADFIRDHFANANEGKNKSAWKIPSFSCLHPEHAFPWHLLFYEPNFFSERYQVKNLFDSGLGYTLKKYTLNELLLDQSWKSATPINQQTKVDSSPTLTRDFADSSDNRKKEFSDFSPRFRIVISS